MGKKTKTAKAIIVPIVFLGILVGIPKYMGANWVFFISWMPAFFVAMYIDGEMDF